MNNDLILPGHLFTQSNWARVYVCKYEIYEHDKRYIIARCIGFKYKPDINIGYGEELVMEGNYFELINEGWYNKTITRYRITNISNIYFLCPLEELVYGIGDFSERNSGPDGS